MGAPILKKKWPTWRQVGFQNRTKINKKNDAKIDRKIYAFQDKFLKRFWWILERKWRHVGTNIDEKSMQIAKSDVLINRALAAAGA